MKPKKKSQTALKVTQSQAKMFEYSVPSEAHIELKGDPAELFSLTIGILGDAAARMNRTGMSPEDESKNLQFSARFFNAYLEGKFQDDTDTYLLLLASAAFYLSDVPGSSLVLAKKISSDMLELGGDGLEHLLLWLLLGARASFTEIEARTFTREIQRCVATLAGYYAGTTKPEVCAAAALELRSAGYAVGSPPLGYDIQFRQLVPNKAEANTVRHIFERYLYHSNAIRLKQELDREKIFSKILTYKDGRTVGGKPFSRGALYALLSNPIYIGQIRHKDKTYDGQHEGIIPMDLWTAVQERLSEQASVYKGQKISREVKGAECGAYRGYSLTVCQTGD